MLTKEEIQTKIEKAKEYCHRDLEILKDIVNEAFETSKKNGILNNGDFSEKNHGFNFLNLENIEHSIKMIKYNMVKIKRYKEILEIE